jgi:phosphoglycerate dehydrogenase-like enzyme
VRAHPEWGGVAGVERVVGPGDLAVAVADSDVVICCAMLHAGSRQLFDAGVCAAFEAGAVFVNVARGGLVDEDALLDALDRHHVAGAFLDVFATEPADPSSPLVTHPQVMATPHVAGVTGRMFDRSSRLFADNVRRWAGGAPPEWPVNRPDTPRGIRR